MSTPRGEYPPDRPVGQNRNHEIAWRIRDVLATDQTAYLDNYGSHEDGVLVDGQELERRRVHRRTIENAKSPRSRDDEPVVFRSLTAAPGRPGFCWLHFTGCATAIKVEVPVAHLADLGDAIQRLLGTEQDAA